MKLTEGILRSLCKHYGIQEKNTDSLISQYMSKYGNCDVRSCSCHEIGGRPNERTTIFYWTREHNGQKEETLQRLLDFRQCRVNEKLGQYNPPEATIYDINNAEKHVFCGAEQKHLPLNTRAATRGYDPSRS